MDTLLLHLLEIMSTIYIKHQLLQLQNEINNYVTMTIRGNANSACMIQFDLLCSNRSWFLKINMLPQGRYEECEAIHRPRVHH